MSILICVVNIFVACEQENNPQTNRVATSSPVVQSMADWVIKTYETKPDAGQASVKALNRLLAAKPIESNLYKGDENFSEVSYIIPGQGRAWLAGVGLVALNAAPEIHEGVAELIEKITLSKAKSHAAVSTEVWSLVAIPASTSSRLSEPLEKAVKKFRDSHPGFCIVEVDHILVPSVEGSTYRASGAKLKIKGATMRVEDEMMANVEISGPNRLTAMIKGHSGEIIPALISSIRPSKIDPLTWKACGVDPKSVGIVHAILAIKLASEG